MRRDWIAFARSGEIDGWPRWESVGRPTRVFGPWPGDDGVERAVDRPRDDELEAVAGAVALGSLG